MIADIMFCSPPRTARYSRNRCSECDHYPRWIRSFISFYQRIHTHRDWIMWIDTSSRKSFGYCSEVRWVWMKSLNNTYVLYNVFLAEIVNFLEATGLWAIYCKLLITNTHRCGFNARRTAPANNERQKTFTFLRAGSRQWSDLKIVCSKRENSSKHIHI